MPDPSLILDTCVFTDKKFKNWLRHYNGDLRIPPVVYMERCRQILERGDSKEELDAMLKGLHISVLRFDAYNASAAAQLMVGRNKYCEKCKNIDWVDTIIASYLHTNGDYIITNNKNDFPTSNGFESRVLTTNEAMNRIL